jgi:hypothetical protein
LWIEIDKQNPLARLRQRGAEINGRGRFTNPAFLISNSDDFHFNRTVAAAIWRWLPCHRELFLGTMCAFLKCSDRQIMLPVAANGN